MPALHSIRMERFARYLIETGIQSEAYLKAGYKASSRRSLDSAASRLSRSVKVKARIRELTHNMVARNRVTVDSVVDELDEARGLALRLDQPSAAITASMSKARLAGLIVDRKEQGAPGEFASLGDEAKVMAMVEAELGAGAASALRSALEQQPSEPEGEPLPEPEPTAAAPVVVPTHGTDGTRN